MSTIEFLATEGVHAHLRHPQHVEPMTVESVIAYGGCVAFPSPRQCAIRVDVTPPNAPMVYFDFPYDHRPP